MSITVEAIYEAGVFKPLTSVPNLKDHEKVRLVVESTGLIADQRQARIQIDPVTAQAIGDSPEYDLFEA